MPRYGRKKERRVLPCSARRRRSAATPRQPVPFAKSAQRWSAQPGENRRRKIRTRDGVMPPSCAACRQRERAWRLSRAPPELHEAWQQHIAPQAQRQAMSLSRRQARMVQAQAAAALRAVQPEEP